MTFSLCEPKEPFHVMTFLDLPNAMRIGELIVNSGAVKPSNEPPMDLTLWLLRALFLNCPFIDSELSCPHVWPPLGGTEWIWCMGLARLLLRRSTDVPTETAPRGMCRHDQVKKAFLLKCEWAEFSGIRVGLNKQVQSETRRGGGWRRVALGFDQRISQNCEAPLSLLHLLTRQKTKTYVHLPVNEQPQAAGGICRKSAFCLKWDVARPSRHPSIPFCSSATVALLLPEAFRLLDGEHELFLQLLIALVRRQVQSIKATREKKKKQSCFFCRPS